ncbi:MAG: DNA primase [Sumerlaeia bacterium]
MADSYKEIVKQIKEQADLVELIGRRVTLQKNGKSFKGKCPFHNEKTPSFHVVPEKGIFHCFGCKASGSVIDFFMRTEHLEFAEAVRVLAKEMNLELPSLQTPEQRQRQQVRESDQQLLFKLNEFALNWYRKNAREDRVAGIRELIIKRDITPDLEEQFELGSCFDDWARFTQAALTHGFSNELLKQSGLVIYHEQKQSLYDRFRNRLLFPIRDTMGRVIGFGGRRIDDSDANSPKYINSSETLVYQKGKTLYGINIAKENIAKKGYSIITEGYMDTIMAHRFGFVETVATLGTALTLDQANLLKRFANRAYFLYDGDSAGRTNMLRAGSALLEAGLDARIIELPLEHDPDSYLREKGPDALKQLMTSAREYVDFALEEYCQNLELQTLAGQSMLVERMAPIIGSIRQPVQKEAAISRLLSRLGDLPRAVVNQIIKSNVERKELGDLPSQQNPLEITTTEGGGLEEYILKLMIESPKALNYFRHELDESWVHHPRFAPWILAFIGDSGKVHDILNDLEHEGEDPADRSTITELMASNEPLGDPLHSAQQLVARIRIQNQRSITLRLLETIRQVHTRNPEELPMKLLKQVHEEARLASGMVLPKAPVKL